MKTKKLGTLVELDPNKDYIMLVDSDVIPREQIYDIKLRNGLILFGNKITEGITFVENSDKIVDIKIRKK